jgi:hypothetical protein
MYQCQHNPRPWVAEIQRPGDTKSLQHQQCRGLQDWSKRCPSNLHQAGVSLRTFGLHFSHSNTGRRPFFASRNATGSCSQTRFKSCSSCSWRAHTEGEQWRSVPHFVWLETCTLRTSSAGQFHLREISGLRAWRNYPFRTTRAFIGDATHRALAHNDRPKTARRRSLGVKFPGHWTVPSRHCSSHAKLSSDLLASM